jgi:hypothetical protein
MAACEKQRGCHGFNVYVLRVPTEKPGDNCRNPISKAVPVCQLWNKGVEDRFATDRGYDDHEFESRITASNGYMRKYVSLTLAISSCLLLLTTHREQPKEPEPPEKPAPKPKPGGAMSSGLSNTSTCAILFTFTLLLARLF